MKNLRKNVILSVAVVLGVLFIMAKAVSATTTPTLIFNTTGNTTTNATTNETANTTANTTTNTVVNTVTNTTNTLAVNNINQNVTKDEGNLPQTGENDVYIVSAIGAVALIVGGVAYAKSRKYEM